jgi:phage baseplate assembly protein W
MAIKDTTRKPYIQDNDTNVKVGIETEEGERFFQPNLGIGLRRLLFEHITNENLIGVQDTILDKMEFWLPFVEIRDIQVLTSDELTSIGANEIRVKILFNIKQDPNTLDSITLSFGSDISEPESSVTSGGGY